MLPSLQQKLVIALVVRTLSRSFENLFPNTGLTAQTWRFTVKVLHCSSGVLFPPTEIKRTLKTKRRNYSVDRIYLNLQEFHHRR